MTKQYHQLTLIFSAIQPQRIS